MCFQNLRGGGIVEVAAPLIHVAQSSQISSVSFWLNNNIFTNCLMLHCHKIVWGSHFWRRQQLWNLFLQCHELVVFLPCHKLKFFWCKGTWCSFLCAWYRFQCAYIFLTLKCLGSKGSLRNLHNNRYNVIMLLRILFNLGPRLKTEADCFWMASVQTSGIF